MQSERNKLLALSKRELIKLCKQNNINTSGCLAKMDFAARILRNAQKKDKKKNKTGKSLKKSNHSKKNIKTAKKNKKKINKKIKPENIKLSKDKISKKDPIDGDNTDENESDYDSDSSFDLQTPTYIESRLSISKVFDINILRNEYDEQKQNALDQITENEEESKKTDINWNYTPFNNNPCTPNSEISPLPSSSSPLENGNIPTFKPSNSMRTILDNDGKENDDKNEIEKDVFKRIDGALAEYYSYFERKDYFNTNNVGKFMEYCNTNNLLIEENLIKQFVDDHEIEPLECEYLQFDDKFPIFLTKTFLNSASKDINLKKDEMALIEIYNVVEYCYHYGRSPY